ncbi:MAG TPA: aminoglycoside phosphotransferase family protein [Caulobacteraceae bacterium]
MSGAASPATAEVIQALRELGLLAPGEGADVRPLTGGVSSDVFGVHTDRGRAMVVKRSIPKLRVTADWRAPVDRDGIEVAWLRAVREVNPRQVPEVVGWAHERHLFAMTWLDPASHPVWKQEMAAGRVDPTFAARVGADLAGIHNAMAGRADIAARFPDSANFHALRIEPFFLYPADRHPDVAPRLRDLADGLTQRRGTLIWGDASPKNILVGPEGPVFLDAETAAIGDPAFDLAFCLTHLLLKTVWLAPHRIAVMASFAALRDAYLTGVTFEPVAALSSRAAALVGALLLARVDGKSPAGYLGAAQEDVVRSRAKALLRRDDLDLAGLPSVWRSFA